MNGEHSDIGPELRQLAQTILDRLDPVVRLAAARAAAAGASPANASRCGAPCARSRRWRPANSIRCWRSSLTTASHC